MEPSNHHQKNHDDDHRLQSDHKPLIISSKAVTPNDQEMKNSSNPSSACVVSEAILSENAGDEREKGPEKEAAGREKLVSRWKEVSVGGGIVIPERWGQEDLLKDWIDYSTFDALLAPKEAALAREALVAEARRECRVSKLRS